MRSSSDSSISIRDRHSKKPLWVCYYLCRRVKVLWNKILGGSPIFLPLKLEEGSQYYDSDLKIAKTLLASAATADCFVLNELVVIIVIYS